MKANLTNEKKKVQSDNEMEGDRGKPAERDRRQRDGWKDQD